MTTDWKRRSLQQAKVRAMADLPDAATCYELLARMKDHIAALVGRYKGRVKGWDVVNEALNEDGTLRQSPWFRIIGPDYIEKAFQFAREADPAAELYYNDYNLDYPAKRDGAVRLVQSLKERGVRIDGTEVISASSHP